MGKGNPRHVRVKRALLLLTLACALAGGSAATAPTAGAVITHLNHGRGKAVSYMPLRGRTPLTFDAAFSNLDYNGGPIMPANTLYPIYWAPGGSTPYPAGYKEGINRWLGDLAHDSGGHENTDSVAAQYGDAEGQLAKYEVHFGGELVDTDPYPANGCTRATICLTDAQIQAELTKFVKAQGLPTDLEHMYMLLTPPKVEDCFNSEGFECSAGATEHAVYCAYHSNAPQSDGSQLIYTNDPFVGEGKAATGCDDKTNHPNGISDSALIGGLSHEHNEAITDPEPNSAWTDFGGIGGESADKCRNVEPAEEFGTPLGKAEDGASYNQEINKHKYWYQQEWSNQGSVCLQRLTLAGSLPTAVFTAKAEPGNTVKVDATGSTSGSGVQYNWQFNEEEPFNTPSEPFETTEKTTEHTYFHPCRYTIALTVFKADGTSAGAAKTLAIGSLVKPEPELSVLTPAPTAGAPVQFLGGPEEDPDGIVTALDWNFGDGSPVVDALAPKHTYGAPGTYEVSLTATDICGESETITAKVTVARAPGEGEGGGGTGGGTGGGATGGGGGGGAVVPAPPAPPPPVLTGKIALPTTISALRSGKAKLKLACVGTAATCSGELIVAVKQTVRVHGHKRTRTVTIATVKFTIATGSATTISLKLNSKGRALLKAAHGHLKALLSLKQSGPAPAKGSVGVRINLVKK